MENPTAKRCKNCLQVKQLSEFGKHRLRKDGLNTECKACNIARSRRWYKDHPERARESHRNWQPKDPERHRAIVNETHRIWRKKNAVKERECARNYREKHKHELLLKNKEWRKKNPEKARVISRRTRIKNTSRINGRILRWSHQHPEKAKAIRHRYAAHRLSLPNAYTADDWQRAIDHFGGCCAACGRPPGLWHTIAADHWIPLSSPDCPGTIPENIIPLCHGVDGCNNSKGSKDGEQWLKERFSTPKANAASRRINQYIEWLKKH